VQNEPLCGVEDVSELEDCALVGKPGCAGSGKGVRTGVWTEGGGTALSAGGLGRGKGTRAAGWAVRRGEVGAVSSSAWSDRFVSNGSQKKTKIQRIKELLLYCRY